MRDEVMRDGGSPREARPDPAILVVGTRASPLALAQARETASRLVAALGLAPDQVPLSPMTTTGDAIRDRPLSEAGGKGLFTKELDEALLAGRIDLAVHSAKDLPTALPDGLAIVGYLPREDARDAFISPLAASIAALPPGAVVGTASLRRGAIVKRARPDVSTALLRGNVGTRLEKLGAGTVAATLLALAGLKRLGLAERATAILSTDEMLPAVGQGAIAIVVRAGDGRVRNAVAPILDAGTGAALAAERAFLGVLDGSCRTPIAGHAVLAGDRLAFRGLVLRPDGSEAVEVHGDGAAADAEGLGLAAGHDLRSRLPGGVLAA